MPNNPEQTACAIKWDWKAVSAVAGVVGLLLSIGVHLLNASSTYADDKAKAAQRMATVESRICVIESYVERTKNMPEAMSRQTAVLERIEERLDKFENIMLRRVQK